MPTLVMDPPPAEIDALIERRRRLGLDRHDEMWEGVLHMNPGPHGRHHRIQQQLAELLGPLALAARLTAAIGDFNLGTRGKLPRPRRRRAPARGRRVCTTHSSPRRGDSLAGR